MKLLPGNAQHIGARESQQDAFGFSDPEDAALVAHGGLVAVVADGMGGMAHGREASHVATRAFLKAYAAKTPAEPIPQALKRSLYEANHAVTELAQGANLLGEIGTTLVAVAFHDGAYHLISVGDSAAYLLRRGRLYQLTSSHTHGEDLDLDAAKGHISEEEAAGDPERHALTSFLGIEKLIDVDASKEPRPLEPGDRLLVCSDGLSKVLGEKEIAASFLVDPQETAEQLVNQVLQLRRPDQDNVTVLVVAYEDERTLEETFIREQPPTSEPSPRSRWPKLKLLVPGVILLVFLAWVVAQLACPNADPPIGGSSPPADSGQVETGNGDAGEDVDEAAESAQETQPDEQTTSQGD